MNRKQIQDSAQRFSSCVTDIQNFFVSDTKHINYFTQGEEVKEVKYVLLCTQGLIVGIVKEEQEEVQISWEEFLTYLYKVHCGY